MDFEYCIDFLQRASSCLWIEDVDDDDHECVENGPDDVELNLKLCDAKRRKKYNHKVDELISRHTIRHAGDAVFNRVDLSRIEP